MLDEELEYYGEEYLNVPAIVRKHNLSFEMYVIMRRQGKSFQKINESFSKAYNAMVQK